MINYVKIAEHEGDVEGNVQIRSFECNVPAQVGKHKFTFSFPFEIHLIRGKWFNSQAFKGDYVSFFVGENTIIGTITDNHTEGDTVIQVDDTVIDNIAIGYRVGIAGIDCGRCLAIDDDLNTITIENALPSDVAVGSPVDMTVEICPSIYLEGTDTMMVLEGGIGAIKIPANTPMTVYYNNINGTEKTFSFILEYFY